LKLIEATKETTMKVQDYKELRVYNLAFDSAMLIFQSSKTWPPEEKFLLTDQIRRSSRSVCTNLAEAWRKRRYEAAFVSKLSDSDGEAAETEVHLDFALRCGYLSQENHAKLRDHYDHICRQLTNMMNDAASWCAASCEFQEMPSEYFVRALKCKELREGKNSSTLNAPAAPRSTT
jgi:four helix bundle protein